MLKVRLLSHTPNVEKVVATAGKLCYSPSSIDQLQENLTEEQIEKFINQVVSAGHHSVVEHASFTFGVEGVSRSLTHQLVRHRIGSYSQQSQRYVRLDQFEYIIPPAIEEIPRAKQLFIDAMEYDQDIYDKLTTLLIASELVKNKKYKKQVKDVMADLVKFDIKLVDEDGRLTVNIDVFVNRFFTKYPKDYLKVEKKAIEDARYVFPNACETKIILTMNVRSLYNFFEHRCCERSQWEIRELATEMLKQVKEVAPLLFKNCGPVCVRGKCQEGNMSCGLSLEKRKLFLSE